MIKACAIKPGCLSSSGVRGESFTDPPTEKWGGEGVLDLKILPLLYLNHHTHGGPT